MPDSHSNTITRRTLLRGIGVTMALPWLESLPLVGTSSASAAAPPSSAPPKRFAALFMGNGISPKNWWAKGAGADMQLSKSLEPLAPFRSELNVITGLFNKARDGRRHPSGTDRQHPLGCRAPEGGRASRRHQHGSGARRPTWARRRRSPAWSWAASSRSPAITRPTSRWPTARTSPGRTPTRRCRWRFIRRWPSTACSTTREAGGPRASSTASRNRPRR